MTDLLLKYFREKEQKVQSEKVYNTQCPFCSMQCKIQLVEQTVVTRKKYSAQGLDNPTTQGRVCIKGLNAHHHAVHKDRITYPMAKGEDGQFHRISWDKALHLIKENFTEIQREDGMDALSVYGGGSLTNESAYLLGKFARIGLQTKYIDYNGRFCMSSAASAGAKVFGIDRGLTNTLSEIPESEVIILAGTNIADCQPTIMPYFEEAKANGAYIIAIDPRETGTTKMADLHLKVKPGKDAALSNGILKVLIEENLIDESFIDERTNGFDEVQEHVASFSLEEISQSTGVAEAEIQKAAMKFGKAATGTIFTARGVEQQTDGHMAVRNFLNILLVTGKIGKPNCGYGAITGQANGQGGREHGQKSDQLPGYRSIENPDHRQYIAEVWGVKDTDIPGKGVSAYEMMEKVHQGEITGMFLMASNPIVSNPNATLVKNGLKKLKYLVAVDMFISETAELADLILPPTSYLENEGTLTNMEGRVMHREGQRRIPGEAKHDWKILCEVARVMGKEEYFTYETVEDIFNELRVASRGGMADYYGMTYERIKEKEGILWPCPDTTHEGTSRLFEERFHHADGRAAMMPVSNEPSIQKEEPSEEFPVYLTTGRVMAHYLTGVQTRKTSALNARFFESFIEIHPSTARKYEIEDNSLVKITSKRGEIVVRSKWSTDIREDTVFVPFHWAESQNVNNLIPRELDPQCRMPGFKTSAVKVQPFTAVI
ncbi:molybdopterin oxidoreductase family protein [Thalassorhabdus alkalitolerans]|uniref:Molybdopterin oxidoreductase family protein n=1 Tax=Thalassorhabdus alkalitolerans TaxID=2282697 RepID=A0ABW0YUI5_9BACI